MRIHIVQKGDSLWTIANQYGVDFEELKAANQQLANENEIMPGMKIYLPNSDHRRNSPYLPHEQREPHEHRELHEHREERDHDANNRSLRDQLYRNDGIEMNEAEEREERHEHLQQPYDERADRFMPNQYNQQLNRPIPNQQDAPNRSLPYQYDHPRYPTYPINENRQMICSYCMQPLGRNRPQFYPFYGSYPNRQY